MELAVALRRVHAAGLRRGFILVAPTLLPEHDVAWWARLCDSIREQTRLRVALLDTPDSDIDAWSVCEWAPRRANVIRELSEHERAGVIELSRGVLTGDPGLLEEARSMGIPAFDPVEMDAAIRDGTLRDLLERPLPEVLPASA